MRRLVLARTTSRSSTVERKKGHSLYMPWSLSMFPAAICSLIAVPTPSQTGSCRRDWVHAKIQGMARSASMPPTLLLLGREPMLRALSSCSGVMARNRSTKAGVSKTMLRYTWQLLSASVSMRARDSCDGGSGGASVARRTDTVYLSMVCEAMEGRPKKRSITSPCTVTRIQPCTDPAGCDSVARYCGPPPLPTEPPRPWNRLSLMPYRMDNSTSASCAL
mmetsp:Transcript_74803/g.200520  ORF Transcript_74803/g.200520 Transcript_74803/m.200520 type:complete len:220 (+) Transcript_74803:685-1344(+)